MSSFWKQPATKDFIAGLAIGVILASVFFTVMTIMMIIGPHR